MKAIVVLALACASCGHAPSSLLRQGQLSQFDFPLFASDGAQGVVYRFESDRSHRILAGDLQDPRGIATDRFGNLFVAEYGRGRVLKLDPETGEAEVLSEGLSAPSALATNALGEVFVSLDTAETVIRVSDGKTFASPGQLVSSLTFGVADLMMVGTFDDGKVRWGATAGAKAAEVANPVASAIDGTGRVYVASGDPENGKIIRFHQDDPRSGTLVAEGLQGPVGIAVDVVGNIFVVEQAAQRVALITTEGRKFSWKRKDEAGFVDPQYLAFTQR